MNGTNSCQEAVDLQPADVKWFTNFQRKEKTMQNHTLYREPVIVDLGNWACVTRDTVDCTQNSLKDQYPPEADNMTPHY